MRVLATFPGRFGDLLWALPTIRALSESLGVPIDLHTTGEFHTILPLLEAQPYLGICTADPGWPLVPPAEWNPPRLPGEGYSAVYHLGYRGWPQQPLPYEVYSTLCTYPGMEALVGPDLSRPWITVPAGPLGHPIWVEGWTGSYFELKYGVSKLLHRRFRGAVTVNLSANERWRDEADVDHEDWIPAAQWMAGARVFVGCCSALHVLAVAMGIPVLLCEPEKDRHNPIFYPLGTDGPQVIVVKGTDGKPTHDARHLGDLLEPYVKGVVPIRA